MRPVTILSSVIAVAGLLSGTVSATGAGSLGGLGQPVTVALGVLIGLTFIPADSLQSFLIRRMGGDGQDG